MVDAPPFTVHTAHLDPRWRVQVTEFDGKLIPTLRLELVEGPVTVMFTRDSLDALIVALTRLAHAARAS